MSVGISAYKKHDLGYSYSTNEKVNKIFLAIERDLKNCVYQSAIENMLLLQHFFHELSHNTVEIEKLLNWAIWSIVHGKNLDKVFDVVENIRLGFSESKVST